MPTDNEQLIEDLPATNVADKLFEYRQYAAEKSASGEDIELFSEWLKPQQEKM
jgi:hypothetical protein